MMGIKNLAVSSGSACTSASLQPSYVLKALGVEEELAHIVLELVLVDLHRRCKTCCKQNVSEVKG